MSECVDDETGLDAGEYALGTLDDAARARFERVLANDMKVRHALDCWEERLNTLGLVLDPVEPPNSAWHHIEANLESGSKVEQANTPAAPSERTRMARWRVAAVAASIVAVVLAVVLVIGPQHDSSSASIPAYASIIRDQKTGMSWVVTVKPNSRLMNVRAMGNYKVPEDKVLKAWIKSAQGEVAFVGRFPHSIGVYSMKISKHIARSLSDNARLMITLGKAEAGNRAPSGTIMWHAPIVHRTS